MSSDETPNAPAWRDLLESDRRQAWAETLLAYAGAQRWFRSKGRTVLEAGIHDVVELGDWNLLVLLEVAYDDGPSELYTMPLARVEGERARRLAAEDPGAIVTSDAGGVVIDGLAAPGFAAEKLFALLAAGGGREMAGNVVGETDPPFAEVMSEADAAPARPARGEQTNSTIRFGARALLKIYRRLEAGPNPELEMGRFLGGARDFSGTPRVLGALWYRGSGSSRGGADAEHSLGVVHEYLTNDGDAWNYVLRELRTFFARVSVEQGTGYEPPPAVRTDLAALLSQALEPSFAPTGTVIGSECAERLAGLGSLTGDLHLALAARPDLPAFAPEPLTAGDRATLAARADAMLRGELAALAEPARAASLPAAAVALVRLLSSAEARRALTARLDELRDTDIATVKIRTHGDLHLGQALCRGRDFVIVDFEGEPARPLAERRAKSSPLRDVVGLVRSLDYAPRAALDGGAGGGERRSAWGAAWTAAATIAYLRGYLARVKTAPLIFFPLPAPSRSPSPVSHLALLLGFYQIEKVIYEIGYEAHNRPEWLPIPLGGLAAILGLAPQRND